MPVSTNDNRENKKKQKQSLRYIFSFFFVVVAAKSEKCNLYEILANFPKCRCRRNDDSKKTIPNERAREANRKRANRARGRGELNTHNIHETIKAILFSFGYSFITFWPSLFCSLARSLVSVSLSSSSSRSLQFVFLAFPSVAPPRHILTVCFP